jgi:aconitate hydratase
VPAALAVVGQEAKGNLRIDTPAEVRYYHHGGILPYVLRQLLGAK